MANTPLDITLLGTGLPFPNPDRAGPSYLVRAGDMKVMVDCGSGAVRRLVEAGHSPGDIHHLFVSHLHSDHVIDLGHFIVSRWIMGDDRPLHLYGPDGLQYLVDQVLAFLEPDLSMRKKIRTVERTMPEVIVTHISQGQVFEDSGFTITAFDVEHFPLAQPFGYRFDTPGRSIVFSGDTCPCDNLIRHAMDVDVLVHECTEAGAWKKEGAARQIDTSHIERAHTQPDQLGTIAREARAKTLVATHLNPQSDPAELQAIIARDYAGPILIGEDLMRVKTRRSTASHPRPG